MRLYLISDNHDTVTGMRLCGIEGVVLHDAASVEAKLRELSADEQLGVVLITEKSAALCGAFINELRLNTARPLIVEIPDRHGGGTGSALSDYLSDAVGIKL